MNAMVLVITALVVFALAYRFYFSFIAAKVLVIKRPAPPPPDACTTVRTTCR